MIAGKKIDQCETNSQKQGLSDTTQVSEFVCADKLCLVDATGARGKDNCDNRQLNDGQRWK